MLCCECHQRFAEVQIANVKHVLRKKSKFGRNQSSIEITEKKEKSTIKQPTRLYRYFERRMCGLQFQLLHAHLPPPKS
jgi:hypothetical protein